VDHAQGSDMHNVASLRVQMEAMRDAFNYEIGRLHRAYDAVVARCEQIELARAADSQMTAQLDRSVASHITDLWCAITDTRESSNWCWAFATHDAGVIETRASLNGLSAAPLRPSSSSWSSSWSSSSPQTNPVANPFADAEGEAAHECGIGRSNTIDVATVTSSPTGMHAPKTRADQAVPPRHRDGEPNETAYLDEVVVVDADPDGDEETKKKKEEEVQNANGLSAAAAAAAEEDAMQAVSIEAPPGTCFCVRYPMVAARDSRGMRCAWMRTTLVDPADATMTPCWICVHNLDNNVPLLTDFANAPFDQVPVDVTASIAGQRDRRKSASCADDKSLSSCRSLRGTSDRRCNDEAEDEDEEDEEDEGDDDDGSDAGPEAEDDESDAGPEAEDDGSDAGPEAEDDGSDAGPEEEGDGACEGIGEEHSLSRHASGVEATAPPDIRVTRLIKTRRSRRECDVVISSAPSVSDRQRFDGNDGSSIDADGAERENNARYGDGQCGDQDDDGAGVVDDRRTDGGGHVDLLDVVSGCCTSTSTSTHSCHGADGGPSSDVSDVSSSDLDHLVDDDDNGIGDARSNAVKEAGWASTSIAWAFPFYDGSATRRSLRPHHNSSSSSLALGDAGASMIDAAADGHTSERHATERHATERHATERHATERHATEEPNRPRSRRTHRHTVCHGTDSDACSQRRAAQGHPCIPPAADQPRARPCNGQVPSRRWHEPSQHAPQPDLQFIETQSDAKTHARLLGAETVAHDASIDTRHKQADPSFPADRGARSARLEPGRLTNATPRRESFGLSASPTRSSTWVDSHTPHHARRFDEIRRRRKEGSGGYERESGQVAIVQDDHTWEQPSTSPI